MAPVAGNDGGHRGADVLGVVPPRHAPPSLGVLGKVPEYLAGQPAQQIALVLEVDVEAGTGYPGLGGEPVHTEFGEARAVAHQPFRGVEQLTLDLLAPLLPLGLRPASDRRHGSSFPTAGQSVTENPTS